MKTYLRLINYSRPYILYFFGSVLCTIILSGATGAIAYLVEPAIDDIFKEKNFSMLYIIPVLMAAMYFVKGAADFGQQYLIGYVGVISKQEGLNFLVDSCSYIVKDKNRDDIHFICVGGGTELKNIKEYASEKDVERFFTFTGRVSDKMLFKALNTADVCVNPDVFNEMNDKSTMTKIMEYMALKKPIVQFDLKEGKFS